MPTYEYACKSCGEHLEIVQSFKDDSLTDCPNCDGGELRKVYSAAGIIFKGDGWHIKDYGDKKKTATSTTGIAGDGDSSSSDKAAAKDSSSKDGSSKDSSKDAGPAKTPSSKKSDVKVTNAPTTKAAAD